MESFEEGEYPEVQYCFPSHNSSCTKDVRSRYEYIIMYVFFSSISFFTVFVNLLVIISISHFRQLHTPTNLLILSLAVVDLLIGGIVMPMESIRLIETCWYFGKKLCSFLPAVLCVLISVSLGNLVFIAIDRYVAVCDPFLYSSKITIRISVMCITLCWLVSLVYNLVLLNMNGNMVSVNKLNTCLGQCLLAIDFNWSIIDLTFSFILPCSILLTLYMIIFRVAENQARAINALSGSSWPGGRVTVSKMSDRKAAKTLGIVIFVYLMCWIPYYVSILTEDSKSIVVYLFSWLLYMNSFVNPLIYALFYPWFKTSVRHIVTLKILDTSSSHIILSSE